MLIAFQLPQNLIYKFQLILIQINMSIPFQVEEYEELRLDLVDLRSISQIQKAQINELTEKLNIK